MAKPRRGTTARSRRPNDLDDDRGAGTGGFLGQVGLFETANGLPHGPIAIVAAIAAALVIYPLSRLVRSVRRH